MCQFFSAIALRNGDIIHDDATDSHSDLILALPFQRLDGGERRRGNE